MASSITVNAGHEQRGDSARDENRGAHRKGPRRPIVSEAPMQEHLQTCPVCCQALPLLENPRYSIEEAVPNSILTRVEKVIVAFVTEGYSNLEVADVVGTTEMVIKNYMRHIFDKTGMDTRLELALWNAKQQMDAKCAKS